MPKYYQHALAFLFTINEINKNAKPMPNATLGHQMLDNSFNARRSSWNTLELLFSKVKLSNYNCVRGKKLMAAIGGLTSQNSMQKANILNAYKIPQVCVFIGMFLHRCALSMQRSGDLLPVPYLYPLPSVEVDRTTQQKLLSLQILWASWNDRAMAL